MFRREAGKLQQNTFFPVFIFFGFLPIPNRRSFYSFVCVCVCSLPPTHSVPVIRESSWQLVDATHTHTHSRVCVCVCVPPFEKKKLSWTKMVVDTNIYNGFTVHIFINYSDAHFLEVIRVRPSNSSEQQQQIKMAFSF
jgi:hypothetical protein